jgi:hypothetical protein
VFVSAVQVNVLSTDPASLRVAFTCSESSSTRNTTIAGAPSITLDTYSHAIPAMQEEEAARIAELVFAHPAPAR